MTDHAARRAGARVSRVLYRAWREAPPDLGPRDLRRLVASSAHLLALGCGALAWRRLPEPRRRTRRAADLRLSYRLHALGASERLRTVALAVASLRKAGIEPLVLKGWAAARLYPDEALRPSGDVDLAVAPDQYAAASAAIETLERGAGFQLNVDLHAGIRDLSDHDWPGVFERSKTLSLASGGLAHEPRADVRVLCVEDQLRHACLHALRHGAARPLWLCDVAVLLESCTPSFDWTLALRGAGRASAQVRVAIAATRRLLGARCPRHAPAAVPETPLPAWFVRSVLRAWGAPASLAPVRRWAVTPIAECGRTPWALPVALASRWPDPVVATARVGGPWNDAPRWPVQAAEWALRARAKISAGSWRTRERGLPPAQ